MIKRYFITTESFVITFPLYQKTKELLESNLAQAIPADIKSLIGKR